ncbi:EAL domain-containing protein, partial [Bradyrhizobium ottawaense]
QPIVDAMSEHAAGFETLARWHSPRLGWVSPADFIPAAERIGLIRPLTQTLLARALATAKTWPDDIRL